MVEQSVKNWFCVCRRGGTGCPTGFVFTGMVLDCYRMSIQFCVCRHGRTECQKLVLCLQAWWNRMSNRFRNLKLGRTFTMSNRLAPMPLQTSTSVQDLTLKSPLPSQVSARPPCLYGTFHSGMAPS